MAGATFATVRSAGDLSNCTGIDAQRGQLADGDRPLEANGGLRGLEEQLTGLPPEKWSSLKYGF